MPCPNHLELSDFALGKLTADAIDVVAQHVDHCPDCQATIVQLSSHEDTFVAQVKQAKRVAAAEVGNSGGSKKQAGGASHSPPGTARIEPPAGAASSATGGRAMTLSIAEFGK